MHTVETETVEHGKARVHYNADFSGSVLISWRGGTAEIPGEVFALLARQVIRRCRFCGKPATCFGAYEGLDGDFACDDCCGHGCEDGRCVAIEAWDK